MCKDEITFDKLPQALTYLTEQVAELKQLVSGTSAATIRKTCIGPLMMPFRIIQKAKPTTIYALVRKV